jgi:hypothetical protein
MHMPYGAVRRNGGRGERDRQADGRRNDHPVRAERDECRAPLRLTVPKR